MHTYYNTLTLERDRSCEIIQVYNYTMIKELYKYTYTNFTFRMRYLAGTT